jgi:transcriptional regulator with XRE-family HTH domain
VLALRYFRQKRGWTQYELADKANVHPADICSYELGFRVPTEPKLQRLAAALDVSPAYILLRPVKIPNPVFVDSDEPVSA